MAINSGVLTHTLQQCLSQDPVIHNPDFAKPFILQADVSATGLGAILSQEYERQEHAILFLSQKLQPLKQIYPTFEKEALAIKWTGLPAFPGESQD